MYVTVRQQNSPYIRNKIALKEDKSKILKEPLGIKWNLSMETYIALNI